MSFSSSRFISFVFAEFNEAENMVMWEKVIKKSFLFDLEEPCLALRLFKEEIDAAKEGFSFQYFWKLFAWVLSSNSIIAYNVWYKQFVGL